MPYTYKRDKAYFFPFNAVHTTVAMQYVSERATITDVNGRGNNGPISCSGSAC